MAVASSRRRRRFCSRESNSKAIENHNFSPSFKALFYSLSKNAVLTSAENHFQWFVDDMVVAEPSRVMTITKESRRWSRVVSLKTGGMNWARAAFTTPKPSRSAASTQPLALGNTCWREGGGPCRPKRRGGQLVPLLEAEATTTAVEEAASASVASSHFGKLFSLAF